MNPEPLTKVIFRKFRDRGDVIALFPELPGTPDPWTCDSYQHIGQHGSASVAITSWTRPASSEEYASLKRELERIGYRLRVVKRITRHDLEKRKEESSKCRS